MIQPALDRELSAPVVKSLRWVQVNAVVARGRELCREQPLTFAALGDALAREFPAADPHALAIAVRNHVALVQVPPRGRCERRLRRCTCRWTGRLPGSDRPDPAPLVRRYLTAFDPATAADIATWSGLRGIKVLLNDCRRVALVPDDRGRTLVASPTASCPDPMCRRRSGCCPSTTTRCLPRRPDQNHRRRRPPVRLHSERARGRHGARGRHVRATWRTELRGNAETLTVPDQQADQGESVGHRAGGDGIAGVRLPGTGPPGGAHAVDD